MSLRQRLIATYGKQIADDVARLDKMPNVSRRSIESEIELKAWIYADPETRRRIERDWNSD